jgi:hypothetical protein
MPLSPTVVLGIQDRRTREWIESIVTAAGYPVIVKDGSGGLHDLAPDGKAYFVIGETGDDTAALDALFSRLTQQFQGHWNEIVVLGILQQPPKDESWWFKWFADEEFFAITNIARRDWKDWKHSIPGLLRRMTEPNTPPDQRPKTPPS